MNAVTLDAQVQLAHAAVAQGRPLVLYSDQDPGGLVDLVLAARDAEAAAVAFVVRHTSGFLCAAMSHERARALVLPPMHTGWTADPLGTPLGVSVDARDGTTTGISATDRARTLRVLADPAARPEQLTRPGHVVPLIVRAFDVRAETLRGRAAADVVADAGAGEVAALAALVSPADPVRMACGYEALAFADRHRLVALPREAVR